MEDLTISPSGDSTESHRLAKPKRLHSDQLPSSDNTDFDLPTTEKRVVTEELKSENDDTCAATAPRPHGGMDFPQVEGLIYIPDFISLEEEEALLASIEGAEWDNSLKRRVQHYGLRYDYTAKSVDRSASIEPLPGFADDLARKIDATSQFSSTPNQCIVNEYTPGQGINAHIDRVDSFGPEVASISLGSPVVMTFSRGDNSVDVLLERRSIVILTGEARYKWKHGIASRKSDKYRGRSIARGRRVSMTFRTIAASGSK